MVMALKMKASIENDKTSIDGIENDKNKQNQILSAKERFFFHSAHTILIWFDKVDHDGLIT